MTRNDITGWTLAELALVLLFALVAVILPAYSNALRKAKAAEVAEVKARSAIELEQEVQRLKFQVAALKAETKPPVNLRSSAKPTCIEKGVAPGYLFDVTIEPEGKFKVGGVDSSLPDLLGRYRTQLSEADNAGCRQSVRVFYSARLGLNEYHASLQGLEEHFYTAKLGER